MDTVTVELSADLIETGLSACQALAAALERAYREGCMTGDDIRKRGTDVERLRGVFLDAQKAAKG
jgi:hypothetical protein